MWKPDFIALPLFITNPNAESGLKENVKDILENPESKSELHIRKSQAWDWL